MSAGGLTVKGLTESLSRAQQVSHLHLSIFLMMRRHRAVHKFSIPGPRSGPVSPSRFQPPPPAPSTHHLKITLWADRPGGRRRQATGGAQRVLAVG